MIEVLETSREFNKVETYLMTLSPAIISLKTVEDGVKIPVDGFMVFKDVKEETGEASEIMAVITPERTVYCCQSATFKRSFMDIYSIMDGHPYQVIKTSGETKSGRQYINCILDVDSLS